jgi:hypothetical protein
MFGIGAVFFIVVFILAATGLIRGPAKELGVTMAIVVVVAVLVQFTGLFTLEELPARINNVTSTVGFGSDDVFRQRTIVWFILSSIVILTAFLAYHGQETLAYGFKVPSSILGALLGGFVGAVNGYVLAGSIWYYLDALGYPVVIYDWFALPLTEAAQGFVDLLPQNLFGGLVLSAMALGLLWLRILK